MSRVGGVGGWLVRVGLWRPQTTDNNNSVQYTKLAPDDFLDEDSDDEDEIYTRLSQDGKGHGGTTAASTSRCHQCVCAVAVVAVFVSVLLAAIFFLPGLRDRHDAAVQQQQEHIASQPLYNATPVWEHTFEGLLSESCVRLFDIDEDGREDIIIGTARPRLFKVQAHRDKMAEACAAHNLSFPCAGLILALRGHDGAVMWRLNTYMEVFEINCGNIDIDRDGKWDCIGTGRLSTIVAFNPRTGEHLWSGDTRHLEDTWNTYNVVVLPDFNGDGVGEVLLPHGGDPSFQPDQKDRFAGRLILLDGATGHSLGDQYLEMPESRETYMSPVLHTRRDGATYILFGDGGETVGGSFLTISVPDFYRHCMGLDQGFVVPNTTGDYAVWRSNLVLTSRHLDMLPILEIYNSQPPDGKPKGVSVPPVLVDMTGDGVHDILMTAYDGRFTLYDGETLSVIWTVTFPSWETYASPAPGYFDDDGHLDFMVHINLGEWPTYNTSRVVVLDGTNGDVIWSLDSREYEMTSPLTLRSDSSDQRDAFVFRVRGREAPTHPQAPPYPGQKEEMNPDDDGENLNSEDEEKVNDEHMQGSVDVDGSLGLHGARPGEEGARPGDEGAMPGDEGAMPGEEGAMPGEEGARSGEHVAEGTDGLRLTGTSAPEKANTDIDTHNEVNPNFDIHHEATTNMDIDGEFKTGSNSDSDLNSHFDTHDEVNSDVQRHKPIPKYSIDIDDEENLDSDVHDEPETDSVSTKGIKSDANAQDEPQTNIQAQNQTMAHAYSKIDENTHQVKSGPTTDIHKNGGGTVMSGNHEQVMKQPFIYKKTQNSTYPRPNTLINSGMNRSRGKDSSDSVPNEKRHVYQRKKRHGPGMHESPLVNKTSFHPSNGDDDDDKDALIDQSRYVSECAYKSMFTTEVFLVDRSTLTSPVLLYTFTDYFYNYTLTKADQQYADDIHNQNRQGRKRSAENLQGHKRSPENVQGHKTSPGQRDFGRSGKRHRRRPQRKQSRSCAIIKASEANSGAVGDLDGDGRPDAVVLIAASGPMFDHRGIYVREQSVVRIAKVNIGDALASDEPRMSVKAEFAPRLHQLQTAKTVVPLNERSFNRYQPWNQYLGAHSDSVYHDEKDDK